MKASSKFSSHSLMQLVGLGLIFALALGACAPTAAPASAPSAPVPTKAPPTAPAQTSSNSITGIVWQWTSVVEAGKTTTVPNPASYTIIFNADGTTTGQADCNTFKGTYSQQNGFTISVTPDVMAACGTLDSQYLDLLNHVAAGGPDGSGGLALETAGGAQRMTFKNGGAATAAPAPSNTITDINWQWLNVKNKTTNTTTTVPNPENYTIIFRTDGTFTGKADCNNISGTYSQEGGFTIKLGPSTMAYCGEASMDQQYTQLLSSVAAGGPDGAGGLALETAGGEQRMEFKNGGAAPK